MLETNNNTYNPKFNLIIYTSFVTSKKILEILTWSFQGQKNYSTNAQNQNRKKNENSKWYDIFQAF